MKLKTELFISILLIFSSCNTLPVNTKTFSEKNNIIADNSQHLQIYFPEFQDENGNIIEGDGIVIKVPGNITIVIDGFVKNASEKYINFLQSLGISKIDYLIASHYHADHIGTFSNIIDAFEIGVFLSNGVPINTKTSKEMLKKIETKQIRTAVLNEGSYFEIDKNTGLKILGPVISEQDKFNAFYNPGKTEKLINSTSLVFNLCYKDFKILFTGDMYTKGMKKICKKYKKDFKTDVIKVPHHGDLYTTNSFNFIKNAGAKFGILQDPQYLTKTIFFKYQIFNTELLFRDKEGYILLTSDGKSFNISEKTENY